MNLAKAVDPLVDVSLSIFSETVSERGCVGGGGRWIEFSYRICFFNLTPSPIISILYKVTFL